MRRTIILSLLFPLMTLLMSHAAYAQTAVLQDGDARAFSSPPEGVAYANVNDTSPPAEVTITDSGGLWRFHGWIALMEKGQWIEANIQANASNVGVQFWGDTNDGWGRVLVDGQEVWRGNTYGSDVNYPGSAFVKYLEISGLTPGTHTVRVENLGQVGAGGGDDVAVYFFGYGSQDVTPKPPQPANPSGQSFYAVYDRIADVESDDVNVYQAALSGDGKRLVFAGSNSAGEPVLYTANADGSDMTPVSIPADVVVVNDLRTSRDGSRAFFFDRWFHLIYKVENDVAQVILDTNNFDAINAVRELEITADGEYVYFAEDRDDLWRIHHTGGTPERIIAEETVPRDGGTSAHLGYFDIDADGSTIAFLINGYLDNGIWISKHELFVWKDGVVQQLTNDSPGKIKEHVSISGDGSKVVYWSRDQWYAVDSDGGNLVTLDDHPFNLSRAKLTYDGSVALNNLSRLFYTDGSGVLDLFPRWNAAGITLGIFSEANISEDGRRVAFVFEYATFPFKRAVYVGYLNDPDAVPDAPSVDSIIFTPPAMPLGDPDATVTLATEISDPQGISTVQRVTTDGMLAGRHMTVTDLPVRIPFYPNDDGADPDVTSGDGTYTTWGGPGEKINEYDEMTVRVGAQDDNFNVVVADTMLLVGQAAQTALLPPEDLVAEPGISSIELSWLPSPSPDLAGYNIYRATSRDGNYAKINSAPVTGDRYLDTSNLNNGTTYYYYATSVDGAGGESAQSNIALAVFGQVRLFIPDSYGKKGDKVSLPVNIANAEGLEMCAVDIYVAFDADVLSSTGVQKTALTAGYEWSMNNPQPGVVRASIATVDAATLYGEGTLFHLLFDVVGETGETSELAFEVLGTDFYDCDDLTKSVLLDLDDIGRFTVQQGFVLGDLNGDGQVTKADAQIALDIAVDKVVATPEQEAAGDLNGDSRINAADAALIMRLAAGLPLFPTAAEAQLLAAALHAVGFSMPINATVGSGGSVWVPVNVSDAIGIAGVDLVVNYDPFLVAAASARTTALSTGFDLEFNVPVAGQAHISLKPDEGNEDGLTAGSGALVEIQFVAAADATVGQKSPLTLASTRLNDRYGRDFVSSALQVSMSREHGELTILEVNEAIAGLAATNDGPTTLGAMTQLAATMSAGTGVICEWEFGDGKTGKGELTAHTYAAAGEYTVKVTAKNGVNQQTATTKVTVKANKQELYLPSLAQE